MIDRCLLIAALALTCAAAHAGGNLLTNGGFEEPLAPDGSIPGWTANGDLKLQQLTLDPAAHSGQQAACILSTQPTESNSILRQTVAIEPGRDYQLTLWANRDSFVYGTLFRVVLLKGADTLGTQDVSFRTNNTWRPITMAFNAGEADRARVELQTPNTGDWRITVGRRLWVDDVTLVEVDHERDITIAGAGETASAEIDVTEPGQYHLWARVRCAEPTRFTLGVGDAEPRVFRAYTTGEQYWLRPVIPELLITEGTQPIEVKAWDAGARIEQVILTMDPFWQPDDYEPFMAPADALAAQVEKGFVPAERGTVPLTLSAIGDLPAGRHGVSQGVPFPRGQLADASHVRIADGRPVQTEALNRWSDGSIKWLRVSTFAEPGETVELEYGSAIPPAGETPAILVQQDRGGVNVSTGALRFSVPNSGPELLEGLTDGERTVEGITGVLNGEFLTLGEREVAVEEAGPVRAVIRIAGRHTRARDELMDYVVRVFAYAGESHLRVEHSFVLTEDLVSTEIDSLVLRMDTPVESAVFEEDTRVDTAAGPATLQAELALGPVPEGAAVGTPDQYLTIASTAGSNIADHPWSVQQAGEALAGGKEATGRLIAEGPGRLVIDVMDFARNAPKTLTAASDHVEVGLVGGPLTFYHGMMKTHELVIALGEGAEQAADAFEAQPLLLATPEWYCDSRATGHWPMADTDDEWPGYASCIDTTMTDWANRQDQGDRAAAHAGMLHWGDVAMYAGGNNLETALGEGAMIQFLRTGRRDYFDFADVGIRHFSDIDIDHSDVSGGLIWVHGPHARDAVDPGRAGINGHSWYNGTALYGLFTGSQRILDTGRQVGEYYSRWPFDPQEYIHYWRLIAWKFMDLNQAFELTGDVRCLEAALEDVRVTQVQQDQMIALWPYMYAIGLKGLRQYYDITHDPGVRELYLQIMDGFMHLRMRPGDTVNGEWPKTPEQLLGNFPNDRSCAYYNEAAHATWLSGDERFARAAGSDLAFQIAFNVNDPTLLWGSADLVRAMDQLGMAEPETAAKLPAAFMTASSVSGAADRPTIALQVVEDADRDFVIDLFKTSYRKYTHDYHGTATVYAPDGAEVARTDVRTSGLQRFRLNVPADGQTGVYTVLITVDDPWRWTLDALGFELDAGPHVVRVCPRYDRGYVDAVCIAPAGEYFPTLQGDPPAGSMILQPEDGELAEGYEVVDWVGALGGKAIRSTTTDLRDDGPWATIPFEVAEAGRYRFFAREWKGYADLLNVQIDDQEPFQCKQSHDMDGNAYPVWSMATTLGEDAIVMPFCTVGKYNMGPYTDEALEDHPALHGGTR